jgi:uncharacterized protein (DUF302 family)
MLEVGSELKLQEIEGTLRRAARHQEASVLSVTRLGEDALVFCVCAGGLHAALLAADARMAAFLPCRIAVYPHGGRTILQAASPLDFCKLLNRYDLAPLALPLEEMLRRIMRETATPLHTGGLGATEEQMNIRGSIPQRIDCKGTKVEELGGTGEHDAQGG